MLARNAWDNVSLYLLTIEIHLADALADSVRILDSNLIDSTTETASHGVFLPLRADARIDFKAVVRRLYSQDILGDRVPVPCCSTSEPAVLGFARLCSILARNHL